VDPGSPDEHWFALLADAMADAVAVIGEDGVVRYANAAAEQLAGHPLAGRQGRDFLCLLHPEDLDLVVRSMTDGAAAQVPSSPVVGRGRDE
jgi:PAS domain S-box-containing protein